MPALEQVPTGREEMVRLGRPTPRLTTGGPSELRDLLALTPPVAPGDIFGPRRGPGGRAAAVRRFGGTAASERAVDRALNWLAIHQDRIGRWSRTGFTRHCPADDVCTAGVDQRLDADLDVGLTALALLAFLARGHIHNQNGPYREVVRRAVEYLLRSQGPDGRFGPLNRYHMYNQGLATLALAEAAALSGEARLKGAVSRAVTYIARAQQPGGGWDYTADKTGRNDTSIFGWQVMAFRSAAACGVRVPWRTVYRAVRCLDRQTTSAGEVAYADVGDGAGRRTTSMVAVGLLCRLLFGWRRSSPEVAIQAERILREKPDWQSFRQGGLHSAYYWYHATLAMFHMGGRYWRGWNPHLRDLLVEHQVGHGHRAGSWEPVGRWSRVGGRVYITALNALCLEVYYRYLPLYQWSGLSIGVEALSRAYSEEGDAGERAAIVHDLGQMRGEEAEAVLRRALDDESLAVRLEAATALVHLGRRAGREVLIEAARHPSSFIRSRVIEVLVGLDQMWVVPVLIERLTDPEPLLAQRAMEGLRRLTGRNFTFRSGATSAERARVAAAWRRWWRRHEGRPASPGRGRRLGSILATRAGTNAVVFSRPEDFPLEPGQLLWVWRGERWIGAVRVVEVLPQMVAGVVVRRAPGEEVRKGDEVSTNPPPARSLPSRVSGEG